MNIRRTEVLTILYRLGRDLASLVLLPYHIYHHSSYDYIIIYSDQCAADDEDTPV
jgi:hypothetical protein